MFELDRSCSLTEFQRNAKAFVSKLNSSREPVLITVNGSVKAVLVDPKTFEEFEVLQERARFFEAIREGEADLAAGRVHSADDVFGELKAKYGL